MRSESNFNIISTTTSDSLILHAVKWSNSEFWKHTICCYVCGKSESCSCRMFQKELYNGIPNVQLYNLCIVQDFDGLYAFKCKRFRNTRQTVTIGIALQSSFWNTLYYQWKSHWTVIIPGKTRCVLLHYDSSKHCTCPLNKFILAFKVVKLFFVTPCIIDSHLEARSRGAVLRHSSTIQLEDTERHILTLWRLHFFSTVYNNSVPTSKETSPLQRLFTGREPYETHRFTLHAEF
jgi:hypothetical protein